MPLLTFEQAMASIDRQAAKRHLLLGNGFSIALKPDIFSYGSLYENADFTAAPHIPRLFEALGTTDFEIVIRHLQDTATVGDVKGDRHDRVRRRARGLYPRLVATGARHRPAR
jgi:Domain of unknown function (DUF4917)